LAFGSQFIYLVKMYKIVARQSAKRFSSLFFMFYIMLFSSILLSSFVSQVSAGEATHFRGDNSSATGQPAQIDFNRLLVFSAGLHKFELDHLHPGREAVVTQDISLINALTRRGVTDVHIKALHDEEATTANCKGALQELLKISQPGDFLFLFIHSHGSLQNGGLICTYEKGGIWQYEDLIQEIEQNFKGDRACVCIAACHSGSILDVIKSKPRHVEYFVLTSVYPSLNAKTQATADFEASIKDVFKGSPCPDLNEDGVITFDEFGRYVRADQKTLFGTVPDFGFTDNFDPQMIISSAKSKEGNLDCALVKYGDDIRGRVIKQNGDRVLVRGSKNPNAVMWVRVGNITRIR
jgi:hypothetical protein